MQATLIVSTQSIRPVELSEKTARERENESMHDLAALKKIACLFMLYHRQPFFPGTSKQNYAELQRMD